MPTRRRDISTEIGLEQIIAALNDGPEENSNLTPETHQRLLRTVRAWLESGPDIRKMRRYSGDPTFHQMSKSYTGWLVPDADGAKMIPVPTSPGDGTRDTVGHYFIQLLLNPERGRLSAPCPQCQLWFVKKTQRKSTFCSQSCARKLKLTKKRARAHQHKLKLIASALDNYATRPQKWSALNWKQWVLQCVGGLTPNFLTHAITNGEIQPPIC